MPRYFFHLSFGQRFVEDEEGVELPNRRAARDEAIAAVHDLVKREMGGNSRRWASWFVDVADESGRFFRTPIGHPALELVTPDTSAPRVEEAAPIPLVPQGARTAELVREMAARRQRTVQLLKENERLRGELSSECLVSQGIRVQTQRLVSAARGAGGC